MLLENQLSGCRDSQQRSSPFVLFFSVSWGEKPNSEMFNDVALTGLTVDVAELFPYICLNSADQY